MRFVADENCHPVLVRHVRQAGHDVEFVLEQSRGSADVDILARAARDNRTIITEDRDFGNLVVQSGMASAGVILLRTRSLDPIFKANRVLAALAAHGTNLAASFIVIEDATMRIRSILAT